MLSLRGGPLEVRSAGLIDKWVAGGTAHPSMIAAASDRGYDLTGHRPAQVDKTLIDWADLVLAMDRSVLAKLHTIGGAESTAKVQLYLEDQHVPDPMGKPAADFTACAAIIEARSARYLP
ncbi:arsenate reductase/protein-tyrosine-phosphatase family protein [Streptomyces aureus]|uniref:Low molecular weight phosphotyrosine protein phosphatase n=1 Tax=Streptomyces aureus TaxID=193461 RepID=A0ABV4SYP1_9ACTN